MGSEYAEAECSITDFFFRISFAFTQLVDFTLYYYNPGDMVNFGQISIEPYEKFPLNFPDAVNQEANFGISLVIDESNQTIVGAHSGR